MASSTFFDQPPGLVNTVVIPMDVKFEVGNIEPLVCTLSLYHLPPKGASDDESYRGKISEDFVFPSGDWKNLLSEKGGEAVAKQMQMPFDAKASQKRLRKAIFSYDPNDIATRSGSLDSENHLYLLLQVHKVVHRGALNAYVDSTNASSRKGFFNTGNKSQSSRGIARERSEKAFKTFGTQFLTPFCFGIIPLLPQNGGKNQDQIRWPNGVDQTMHLFSHNASLESENSFLDKLSMVAHQFQDNVDSIPADGNDEIEIQDNTLKSFGSSSILKMRRNKKHVSDLMRTSSNPDLSNGLQNIAGKASFRNSLLDVDFSESLLRSPDISNANDRSSKPLMLVDSSGDSAIIINPEATDSNKGKRSDLIRLKTSTAPAGYADSSEVRQVLYFPTGTRQIPPQLSPWAPINFLYLYPSSMKLMDKESSEDVSKHDCYSIRVRLVKQVKNCSEMSYVPETLFYNPSLIGDPLVTAVYTKIPLFATSTTSKRASPKVSHGIPFRDEIKMKLPVILDGTYFLQFTLYSLRIRSEVDDHGGLEQNFVAESLIPLASLSSKEPILGTKVVTVIPDGVHRIKLSSFQLLVRSKLMSNIHVSDPCIAAVLRDFPSQVPRIAQREIIPYVAILSGASIQSVHDHLHTLLFLFLRECMSSDKFRFSCKTMSSTDVHKLLVTLEYLRGICCIIDKVKQLCNTFNGSAKFIKGKLLKEVIDNFDENIFIIDDEIDDSPNEDDSSIDLNESNDQDALAPQYNTVKFEKGLSRKNLIHNSKASKRRRKYVDKFYASLDNTSPMNRKAYGVTKIDRLKAEAELYESENILTELVDDEETIVTATTWQSHLHRAPTVFSSDLFHDGQAPQESIASNTSSRFSQTMNPLERAKNVAIRLNNAAKTIMAPCISPSFVDGDNPSPTQKQSYGGILNKLSKDSRVDVFRQKVSAKKGVIQNTVYEGSDDEIQDSETVNTSKDNKERIRGEKFRGTIPRGSVKKFQLIELTLSSSSKSDSVFMYERILALWLHLLTNQNTEDRELSAKYSEVADVFLSHIDFLFPFCLKSLALRLSKAKQPTELIPSSFLDADHLQMISALFARVANSLLSSAKHNIRDPDFDHSLQTVLMQCDSVIDFITGLFALIHPQQVSQVVSTFVGSLQDLEDGSYVEEQNTEDPYKLMGIISCCRQLRIRCFERLASLPNFVALNFPYKYSNTCQNEYVSNLSWINQNVHNNFIAPVMDYKVPKRHWLAELVIYDCLSIAKKSSETIFNGWIPKQKVYNSTKKKSTVTSAFRQRTPLPKDLIMHEESISRNAISIVYDILLRKNALDLRYQNKESFERIVGMFVSPLICGTTQAVHVISKMDPSDKVRNQWLLCMLCSIQEAPDIALRNSISSLCGNDDPSGNEDRVVKFIKVLGLCASSFQTFASEDFTPKMAPWLLQESFNTISAACIVVVDECFGFLSSHPLKFHHASESALSLLLKIVSAPLPPVTLLRALGATSHMLDRIGSISFLSAAGDDLQHWGRMILSHMNSTSLSVRSMAVDLLVSLISSIYKDGGFVDEVGQIFVSILPEIVAREIGLYSQFGHVRTIENIETCIWPLRRALYDIEETDPMDDDRVDSGMIPFLKHLCRACHAVIDGVIIELRLKGNGCSILGTAINMKSGKSTSYYEKGPTIPLKWCFDADEESLFEAADFFKAESSPVQRIRWLLTLKRLHCFKGQWIEAAETLLSTARTVAESIPHVKHIWRPSRYEGWQNVQGRAKDLFTFADDFLEPITIRRNLLIQGDDSYFEEKLPDLNILALSKLLTSLCKEAVEMYKNERSVVPLAYDRLQGILKIVMNVVEDHASFSLNVNKKSGRAYRQNRSEEMTALRKVSATLNEIVTKLSERMRLLSERDDSNEFALLPSSLENEKKITEMDKTAMFVRLLLLGKKSNRFIESSGIPTFLDWDTPHICRISRTAITKVYNSSKTSMERDLCRHFAEPLIMFLQDDKSPHDVVFSTEVPEKSEIDANKTYIIVTVVRSLSSRDEVQSKKFQAREKIDIRNDSFLLTDLSVARPFPCSLSRQPIVLSNEYEITDESGF